MHLYHRLAVVISISLLCLLYIVFYPSESRENVLPRDETNTRESDLAITRKMQLVESENSRRLDRVESVCKKYRMGLYKSSSGPSLIKHPPTPQYQVFFFDRANKWSICPIYKAGSTTWLFHLLVLADMTEEEISGSGRQLSEMVREKYPQVDPSTAEQLLQTTTKIMTVRHPFERVLSAYRDKLENINYGWEHGTNHFYEAYGKKIVKKYRTGGSDVLSTDILQQEEVLRNPKQPAPAGVEPTFEEFVRYLIESNLVGQADDHWIPYYLYCTPCLLKYQFIAKTETLDQDQMYIIQALGLGDRIKPRWRHKTQFNQTDSLNTVSSTAQVYFRQLTTSQVLQLYEKYKIDFELFGYDYLQYLQYTKKFPS